MTVDHASAAFYRDRIVLDAASAYRPGMVIPVVPFLVRFVSYICAPLFLVVSGASLALTIDRKSRDPGWRADGYIAARAAILIALDVAWMSVAFSLLAGRRLDTIWIEVLSTIGACMLLMIPVRRLPVAAVLAALPVLAVGGEWLSEHLPRGSSLSVLFFPRSFAGHTFKLGSWLKGVRVAYPLALWAPFYLAGWCFGKLLVRARTHPSGERRILWTTALTSLGGFAVFLVVRGINGYGNAHELRDQPGVLQWLNVSSSPPSLSHMGLCLGMIGAVLLVGFFRDGRGGLGTLVDRALVTFGQSALFFYLIHIHLLVGAALALGLKSECGLLGTFVAFAATLSLLLPLCARYHAYRVSHPKSWTRFF